MIEAQLLEIEDISMVIFKARVSVLMFLAEVLQT